eukprot:5892225-Alexandrium_andersonii.AAC.1
MGAHALTQCCSDTRRCRGHPAPTSARVEPPEVAAREQPTSHGPVVVAHAEDDGAVEGDHVDGPKDCHQLAMT